jgi:hypothetical protein
MGKAQKVDRNPEVAEPQLLAALRAYWARKRDGREMPRREDIVPGEIKYQLTHVLLADVIDGGRDFRYRLVGSGLHRSFTAVPTGRLMSEALAPFGEDTVHGTIAAYRQVVLSRAPLRLRGAGALYGQDPKYFDALLMPLSDDGTSVNMIFGAFFFDWDRENVYRQAEDEAHWDSMLRQPA